MAKEILVPPSPPEPVSISESVQHLKCLIDGYSGVGKTSLASTAPKDIVYLNVDKSATSIKKVKGIHTFPPYVPKQIDSWNELTSAVRWIGKYAEWLKAEHGIRTVVLDSATEASDLCARQILIEPSIQKRPIADRLTQSDYGTLADRMLELIRDTLALPFHIVVTTQVKEMFVNNDDDSGTVLQRYPAFKGKETGEQSPKFFDIMGYLTVPKNKEGKSIRRLELQPIGNRKAKIRVPLGTDCPEFVDNPNLEQLFNFVLEASNKEDK